MRLQRKDMQLITNIKWRHKEGGLDVWLNLLKEARKSQTSAVDFVEDFKMNSKEIYVLHKEILSPYQRTTSLDSIHSEIGIKTRGTRVNGKLVPLNYELKMGPSRNHHFSKSKPTINWLDYVTTSRAKNKIRNVLNENTKAEDGKRY
jgi:GTP pyrophosphokinase